MDLKQRKLTKSEWDALEIPVNQNEIEILKLIINGYKDVNMKYNKNLSLISYLKITPTKQIEDYLYNKYFNELINNIIKKYKKDFIKVEIESNKKIKSADLIRLQINSNIENKSAIYEYVLIEYIDKLFEEKRHKNNKWIFYYFTLYKLNKYNILDINKNIKSIVEQILKHYEEKIDLTSIIANSPDYIERNFNLLKYEDMTLFEHQKEIFSICKSEHPKLILYIAPTGTGKTLTPIGLSENNRIIFVCAARHVGLALAKNAISVNRKIAFAFGCSCSEDVRLHYFAAKEYTTNKRSGRIQKVDNTIGDKVEIIICDIKSYLPAMYYMLAFNKKEKIITYWDEPTITLDYDNHDLHQVIQKNWKDNLIPNMVLSSATLPNLHELTETTSDFKKKFPNSRVHSINSYDCRKTIPLINNNGYVVMPHNISDNFDMVKKRIDECENNLSLLRYLDLYECSKVIAFAEKENLISSSAKIERNFGSLDDINMKNIKLHYIKVMKNINAEKWISLMNYLKLTKEKRIIPNNDIDNKGNKIKKTTSIGPGISSISNLNQGQPLQRLQSQQIISSNNESANIDNGSCGIYVTTKDAFTLTDGPTIFLANDVNKVAKFCIQQASIPVSVMQDLTEKIEYNNLLNEKIDEIEKRIEDELAKTMNKNDSKSTGGKSSGKKTSKKEESLPRENTKNTKIIGMEEQVESMKKNVKIISVNPIFIPNKIPHINKWAETQKTDRSFTSNIAEEDVISIMLLKDVEDSWKILLLLGIGVFTEHKSIAYTEIMKKLAETQKLYMIIADSDYIYGTNYQFCHGYISKDMILSKDKIIQAMGRIGRNNIQQDYTIRFRDDEQINLLFRTLNFEEKPECINMNRLFNSKKMAWINNEFVVLPEDEEEINQMEEEDDEDEEYYDSEEDEN